MDLEEFSYAAQLEWAIRILMAAARTRSQLGEFPWPWCGHQEDFEQLTAVGERWLTRAAGHLAQRLETVLRGGPAAAVVSAKPMPNAPHTCPGSLERPKQTATARQGALVGQCAICLRWLTLAAGGLMPSHLERRLVWGDRRSFVDRRQREWS